MLPLLYHDFKNGERWKVMVGKKYADILDGVSYVEPVIFDGEGWELERAVEEANCGKDEVFVSQVVGPTDVVAKHVYKGRSSSYESFAKEQWAVIGRYDLWRTQPPLVFDQRNEAREAALLTQLDSIINEAQIFDTKNRNKRTKKIILVAVDGFSSPFPHKKLLMELLRLKFWRNHHVIDLSQFKAERLYDLLALYERASVLVASDSAPLHLAWAIRRLPVVALINDRPTPWHGSPWRPTHICHIRYSDFHNRALEILDAIDGLGKYGCPFAPRDTRKGPRIIHAWSRYEETEANQSRREAARSTWNKSYSTDRWVSCPVEVGSVVKDSMNMIKDELRVPLVKDILRIASLRAEDDDVLCLTRSDTCFPEAAVTDTILGQHPSFARRQGSPAYDLFAFTKAWWREHQKDLPDLLLGKDLWWHRVMMEFIKANGGIELPFTVYQSE
jgi:hypothetical protein